MAKNDDKDRYKTAQQNAATQTANVQAGYNQFAGDIAARTPGDRAAADAERAYLNEQYRGVASGGADRDYLRGITGNLSSGEAAEGTGGGGGGGGGSAAPTDRYGSVRGGFNEFAQTGGVDYGRMTEALGTFRNLASTGGFTDENRANLANIASGYDKITGQPIDRKDIDPALKTLTDAQTSGGYAKDRLDSIYGDINSLRNFETMTPERQAELRNQQNRLVNFDTSDAQKDIDKLRGLDENYANWERTGGYTESDKQNIRDRATSTIPSFYAGVKDEIARRNALSGGYAPGYSSSVRALSRDSARGTADAARSAELGISDRVRAGQQYGLTGRAGTASSAGDLSGRLAETRRLGLEGGTRLGQELDLGIAGNRLRGLEGATSAGAQLEADIAGNRLRAAESGGRLGLDVSNAATRNQLDALAGRRQTELDPIAIANEARLGGARGITDTSQGAEKIVQSGRQFGLGGLMGIAQAEQAAADAAASRGAASSAADRAYELQRAQLASQNERFSQERQSGALGGLGDLYRSAPGQVGMYNDDYLNALSGQNQSIATGVLAQQNQPKGQSWWENPLASGIGVLGKIPWGGGGGDKTPASSYTGYSDEFGRPLEGSQGSYFGTPTMPYPTAPGPGQGGTVTTDEDYRYPNTPDSPNNNSDYYVGAHNSRGMSDLMQYY